MQESASIVEGAASPSRAGAKSAPAATTSPGKTVRLCYFVPPLAVAPPSPGDVAPRIGAAPPTYCLGLFRSALQDSPIRAAGLGRAPRRGGAGHF